MKKTVLFIVISVACSLAVQARHIVTGKVIDALSRQPLEAAYVREENNPAAKALTDHYGNFVISVGNDDTVRLLVSYVGFQAITVPVTGTAPLKIEMQPAATSLKDVVVLQGGGIARFNTLGKIDLDLKPVRNTQELMRLVPGLFIAQHAGGGKAEQIFLRGFDCDHGTDVQVSVDGLPVNMVSHAHGQGYADTHFIIPETINGIDYGAGPYYTPQGNLNTAGYIAFGTYNNLAKSRVQVEAGRYNTFRTLAMIDLLQKNKDRQSAWIAGDLNYTDGPTDNKQHFNRFNVFGKYNLAVSPRTQLTASLSAFKSKWDASGQIPTRAVEEGAIDRFGSIDPSEGGNTERYNANIVMAHTFSDGTVWENQAYYSRYIFNLYSDFTFYLNDPVNGDEINQAEKRNLLGYQSKLQHKYIFNNWSLQSSYGAGLRYDMTTDSRLAHVVTRQFLRDVKLGDITESNGFAYMQQQAGIGRWQIDAGIRVDYLHFNYFDRLSALQPPAQGKAIVSPKINVQYSVNPQVQLFVKTGKGFHSNDTRVVVANDGKQILPAAYGADLGIVVKPLPELLISAAAWYLKLDQEFAYVGDDGNIEPSGKTRREGIDVIARYQFSRYLFAHFNINFTKPRVLCVAKGQDYIPLAPTATSTGGLFYKKDRGFNGGLSWRYIKDRPANEDNSIVAKGYFLLDGSFNYTQPKYEVGLAVENIFNVKWNEAQFATESRLRHEAAPVTELNFTPGTPFFARMKVAVFF